MKRFTFISLLTLFTSLAGMSQNALLDDIYFKPGDATNTAKSQAPRNKPNIKNGAKEIIYIDRETPKSESTDTVVLAQANDNIMTSDSVDGGHYLNGFKGNQSDLEYAERIRRFHSPKHTIFIGDPNYNNIYYLNDNDWNVYVDGSYAYVTPTWSNPYWWNYNYGSMGYGAYGGYNGYGWNSPFYGFGWNSFYGYGSYYGGFGYGGYYGYDSFYGGMYGYGDYYGYPSYYGGYGYGGYYGGYGYSSKLNSAHNEGNRRSEDNKNSTGRRYGDFVNATQNIGGSSYSQTRNQYTVVSGSRTSGSTSSTQSGLNSSYARSVSAGNGIGAVRNNSGRTTSNLYQSYNNSNQNSVGRMTAGNGSTVINTRPRTAFTSSTTTPPSVSSSTSSRGNYSTYNSGNTTMGTRSAGTYNSGTTGSRATTTYSSGTPTYNSGSRSTTYTPSSSNSSSRSSSTSSYSSPTYSSPSYNSSSSYSSGSSSSGSSSSSSGGSSSGGGGSRSSGGGSSAGSRR